MAEKIRIYLYTICL